MKILLAGDSWGIGVFEGSGNDYTATGEGIHSILERYGHSVVNISKAGGSNWLMLDRMNGRWLNTGNSLYGHSINQEYIDINWHDIDIIVFLQTDIFRERYLYVKRTADEIGPTWKHLDEEFVNTLLNYETISNYIDEYFLKFYSELNSFALRHHKQVLMIGGWSQLHPSIDSYSNLVNVMPSATKFLIPEVNEDTYLSDPEWYDQLASNKQIMDKFGLSIKQLTISNADKLEAIYKNWKDVHPNINGYALLTEQLIKWM